MIKCNCIGEYFGPLAHLVERIHGMDEVTGSIPVWSTNLFLDVSTQLARPPFLGYLAQFRPWVDQPMAGVKIIGFLQKY